MKNGITLDDLGDAFRIHPTEAENIIKLAKIGDNAEEAPC